ncbi:hypothetical protein [Metallosphaera hakonensis]|nr:hypothetical protein [Metallosphaera hakonensis]
MDPLVEAERLLEENKPQEALSVLGELELVEAFVLRLNPTPSWVNLIGR